MNNGKSVAQPGPQMIARHFGMTRSRLCRFSFPRRLPPLKTKLGPEGIRVIHFVNVETVRNHAPRRHLL